MVFYGGMDATGGPLLKQARELGMKAVFAFGDGACTDKMHKLAGEAAEGMLCSQAGIPRQAADPPSSRPSTTSTATDQAVRALLLRRDPR